LDIFEKMMRPNIADELREKNVYPYFHALESRQDTVVQMEGKRRIMLGSNNYLGLTTNERVIEAGIKALEKYGTGCSGSRFLNGTLEMHLELEKELAEFLHKDAVMTFSTGFQSNLGIISAVVGMGDYVISDKENHASIYDGIKLSYGKMLRFKHADMEDLERQLQKVPENAGSLIVTDGVFSMGGDIAKLPEIVALAKKYGARVMVDDAHGLGVIGEGGRGTASYFGLEDEVDIYMGTFSKIAGVAGRLYGGLGPGGGLCAPQQPAVHFFPPRSRRQAAPRRWLRCGSSRSIPSCPKSWRTSPAMPESASGRRAFPSGRPRRPSFPFIPTTS
jgi:7-keto-8-aminopelargonate synthetase and related enzymes